MKEWTDGRVDRTLLARLPVIHQGQLFGALDFLYWQPEAAFSVLTVNNRSSQGGLWRCSWSISFIRTEEDFRERRLFQWERCFVVLPTAFSQVLVSPGDSASLICSV